MNFHSICTSLAPWFTLDHYFAIWEVHKIWDTGDQTPCITSEACIFLSSYDDLCVGCAYVQKFFIVWLYTLLFTLYTQYCTYAQYCTYTYIQIVPIIHPLRGMFINSDIPIRIPINYRDGSPYHIHCHVVGLLARMHSCRWFTFAKLPCPTFDSRRELTQTDKPFLWSLPNLPSSSTMYCISHDIFKTTPTSGLKSSTIMMFSIWVCSEIGFLETNRVDHHSRLICEPRLLAVLGVCQWIVTTVLKLSHCSRNLGEVWVRAELLWGNVLPSQKSSPFFCMSVPASKTLRACRMNFRFYMWTTSHALQTRPIPWIAPACFFFWGDWGIVRAFEKGDHCGNWRFSGLLGLSWLFTSTLAVAFFGWATGCQQLEPAQRVQATAVNYDQMKYEYEWIWCMMLGCIYSPVWECLASNLVADKGKQDIFSLPPLTLTCHLLHLWNWRSLQDCFT
jgi:hypothetical protein